MSLERVQFLLAKAESNVAECEARIEGRRKLLAHIGAADTHDAQAARAAVHQWEQLRELHVADRDRLRRELAVLKGHTLAPGQVSGADVAWAAMVQETIQEILAEGDDENEGARGPMTVERR